MQTTSTSTKEKFNPDRGTDANRDPITGTPGAHPIGTGLGAAGAGAAAGAVGGAVAGPIGAAAGAVIGAVAGGLAGKGVAEKVNPTAEHAYWKSNYAKRPYASTGSYDDYGPAYQYGWESYTKHAGPGKNFDSVESDLSRGWQSARGKSKLEWDRAKEATRDAWHRVEKGLPGDADGDGY